MAAVSSSRQRGGEGTSWEHRRNRSEDNKQNFSLPYQVPSPPQSPSNQDEFMSSGNRTMPGRNIQADFDNCNDNLPETSQFPREYQQPRAIGRGAPQNSDYNGGTSFSRMRQPSQPEGRQERPYNAAGTSRYTKKGNLVRTREDDSNWVHRDKLIALEIQDHIDRGEKVPQALLDAQAQAVSAAKHPSNRYDAQHDLTENNLHQLATNTPPADGVDDDERYVPEDPRTPEEIAAEFKPSSGPSYYSPGNRSGSRIPVSKSGTRSRSQSVGSQVLLDEIDAPDTPPSPNQQRQGSKTHSRKASGTGRSIKSRAASAGAGSASRPTTGDGPPRGTYSTDVQAPWLDEMYKPDPLLPPDQQVLPTHAKRIHQEQLAREAAERQREQDRIDRERQQEAEWERDRIEREKEREIRRKASADRAAAEKAREEQANAVQHEPHVEQEQRFAEKPVPKPLAPFPERFDSFKNSGPSAATPTSEHGGYRTMPKVQGTPTSPTPNPRTPQAIHVQDPEAAAQKKGCGCCVVM